MNSKSYFLAVSLLAVTMGQALAQDKNSDPRTFVVPLTNPGEPVVLNVELISGAVRVVGEDREDVSFTVSTRGDSKRRILTPKGSQVIPITSFGLDVQERNNRIEVDTDHNDSSMQLEIRMPRTASLNLETVHNGNIEVENITGELELGNVHGPITATGIRGSVIAETVHGEVRVELLETSDKPMAFSTVHGNIDVSFPASYAAELHLVTRQDEIVSDFDVEIMPTEPKVSRRDGNKIYRVELAQELVALINGGGPSVRFDTLHGKIIVRKSGD